MYYEESKKNLMALLRQNGCPSVFLTLSCAEFDWPGLLKEIIETVERRKVSKEYVENLPDKEKNKLISENVVQSTLHFQKRIDKIFTLMKHDFFKGIPETYQVSSYFYRIEFQQRGAPHVHSLLWMKNKHGKDAPSFWADPNEMSEENDSNESYVQLQQRKNEIEDFADFLISTSPDEISCKEHERGQEKNDCEACISLWEKVKKYQNHSHTFTCAKKRKTITIKENEGHGRLDGQKKGKELLNIPICRFQFPRFPLNQTKLVTGIARETSEDDVKKYKADLSKIIKYLIRNTYTENKHERNIGWQKLQGLNFWEFLYEVGMFSEDKLFEQLSNVDKTKAKERYLNAISASIRGSAAVIHKRK